MQGFGSNVRQQAHRPEFPDGDLFIDDLRNLDVIFKLLTVL